MSAAWPTFIPAFGPLSQWRLHYFNNISHADRPQWGMNFQAYATDQINLDEYLKRGQQQFYDQAAVTARTANIALKCPA